MPEIVTPANNAGSRANLSRSWGMARTKETFRTATALEKGVYPVGDVLRRINQAGELEPKSPPAEGFRGW